MGALHRLVSGDWPHIEHLRRWYPKATGDAIYPVVIAIIFNWSIAVGLSYVIGIPLGFGLVGMWVGFALDENIRGVILMRRWRSGKWKNKGFVKE